MYLNSRVCVCACVRETAGGEREIMFVMIILILENSHILFKLSELTDP